MNASIKPFSAGQVFSGITMYTAILICTSTVILDIEVFFTTSTYSFVTVMKVIGGIALLWMAFLYLVHSIMEADKKILQASEDSEEHF